MSPRKAVSAADMLSTARRGASRPPEQPTPSGQPEPAETDSIDTAPLWEDAERAAHDDQQKTVTSGVVDKSTSHLADKSTGAVVAPSKATYVKVAVSLTPELRRWVKTTPAGLGLEGLSSSDLVRLALFRLRQDVEAGLPLADLLIIQAHEEAQRLAGRRNRGMPARED
ncbi:hypothetical protein [Kineococcus sp. SYSU DK006]|uniref:hypothetical protein n=1 Tax=Kineococcus sp. SYSU DK006 TaxID=3383127 RepID=UPI003D7D63BE